MKPSGANMDTSLSNVSFSAAAEGGGRSFTQGVKARLEDVSRAVAEVRKRGASRRSAEEAIAAAEKYLSEARSTAEICSRTPAIFFKKCEHLLRAQKDKLAEYCDEEKEQNCNVTLKRVFAKPADTEEQHALLPRQESAVAPRQGKLAGLAEDYRNISRAYDSMQRVLIEQKPAITLIDRTIEETRLRTKEGVRSLTSVRSCQDSFRWAIVFLFLMAFALAFVLL